MGSAVSPTLARLSDYLFRAAEVVPDREAMTLAGWRLTYSEAAERVRRLSDGLREMDVRPGDRVAMLCTPRPEFFLTLLATVDIGAIWVGLNPRYRADEMSYLIRDSQPRILFALTRFEGRDYRPELGRLMAEHPQVRLVTLGDSVASAVSFDSLGPSASNHKSPASKGPSAWASSADPALIIYTSGSTGEPKGALLTHFGLVHAYLEQLSHIGSDPMVDICNLPINHIGCIDLCCMPLLSTGCIHFMERFDADGLLRLVEKEQVNFLGQVPTIFQWLADSPLFPAADLSSLKRIMWSGSAMPRDLIETYRNRTSAQLMVTYGLTESISAVTYSDPDADLSTLATTVGKPDPNLDVRLVSPDGAKCGAEEEGEIQVRSTMVMAGYFNRPGETAEAFTRDGYLRTGDLGFLRADGNLVLVGRLREMYKSGGYNIYPREIEACLESHPHIDMAAVVGVPDPVYQEVGHAYVVPSPGEKPTVDELVVWCRDHLANFKVPKRITVVSSLPTLANGKVDRQALKRQSRPT